LKRQIDRILETEKEVREKIDQAREKSRKIIREAEAKSREIVDGGRKEAFSRSKDIVEDYKKRAKEERDRQIGGVKADTEDFFSQKRGEIEKAASRITEMLSDPER
jgi:vacuolar-type H+-ATPase subunit H